MLPACVPDSVYRLPRAFRVSVSWFPRLSALPHLTLQSEIVKLKVLQKDQKRTCLCYLNLDQG